MFEDLRRAVSSDSPWRPRSALLETFIEAYRKVSNWLSDGHFYPSKQHTNQDINGESRSIRDCRWQAAASESNNRHSKYSSQRSVTPLAHHMISLLFSSCVVSQQCPNLV